jgi:hypothetical protein
VIIDIGGGALDRCILGHTINTKRIATKQMNLSGSIMIVLPGGVGKHGMMIKSA